MRSETLVFLFVATYIAFVDATNVNDIESRGKKKKIALFVYFADLVLKKFFVLKLIYAFVFWVILHKAGYFLSWFIGYLKEKKSEPVHHEHYPHHHYEYGPPQYYDPYRKQSYDHGY